MNVTAFLRELQRLLSEVVERADEYLPGYLVSRDVELARHGLLAGPQLELKVHGFRRAVWVFRRIRTRPALLKALGWANVILGSLAAVIPGAGAIAEFKQAIERGAEDKEDGFAESAGAAPRHEL